jgi:amino-acid N-acetyltransferase
VDLVRLVRAGLGSVNMVDAASLETELFTYEGAGTLLTAQDYCHVDTLGLDDFHEAARLLARGEREGYLLARDDEARARLLLCGYGAWFEGGRLAGVAGLETERYRRSRVGEVVGLYTITRFKGEGVGVRLIRHLAAEASAKGLRALFACTRNPRAAAFFERYGFEEVDPERAPAAKWRGRGNAERPRVYWLGLARPRRAGGRSQ